MKERMEEAFRDIIDLCNTSPALHQENCQTIENLLKLIAQIDDVAHRGMYGDEQDAAA